MKDESWSCRYHPRRPRRQIIMSSSLGKQGKKRRGVKGAGHTPERER